MPAEGDWRGSSRRASLVFRRPRKVSSPLHLNQAAHD
jgi:hypothetical protein